ncbi:MAG: flavin reductase family protein [Phycisphaeraceae bacterium]
MGAGSSHSHQHANDEAQTAAREQISSALARIPSGLFILTAEHEERRMGMLASFVQQVCFEPAMVTVAVAKGRAIMPLISESRQFGLCQLGENDKVMMRKFAAGVAPNEDPFLGFELTHGQLPNLPLLAASLAYLECELTCHMDVEGDHDLFVGTIRGGACNPKRQKDKPHVHLRKSGFDY